MSCACLLPSAFVRLVFSFENPPDWHEILAHFRGSELQTYFSKILENDLKCLIKPQYVDHVPKSVSGRVGEIIRYHTHQRPLTQ